MLDAAASTTWRVSRAQRTLPPSALRVRARTRTHTRACLPRARARITFILWPGCRTPVTGPKATTMLVLAAGLSFWPSRPTTHTHTLTCCLGVWRLAFNIQPRAETSMRANGKPGLSCSSSLSLCAMNPYEVSSSILCGHPKDSAGHWQLHFKKASNLLAV